MSKRVQLWYQSSQWQGHLYLSSGLCRLSLWPRHWRMLAWWGQTHFLSWIIYMWYYYYQHICVDVCFLGANPCEHAGKCINTKGSFQCKCQQGYVGGRCELDVNECLSNPCQNDATCLDQIGGFHCICMLGNKKIIIIKNNILPSLIIWTFYYLI